MIQVSARTRACDLTALEKILHTQERFIIYHPRIISLQIHFAHSSNTPGPSNLEQSALRALYTLISPPPPE